MKFHNFEKMEFCGIISEEIITYLIKKLKQKTFKNGGN